ncbi:MAG TPA: hypothetical protein VLL97_15020 [Acidobacteriota bacterium]|nr:hypothetical protein [Acidobacteriota bacterium]
MKRIVLAAGKFGPRKHDIHAEYAELQEPDEPSAALGRVQAATDRMDIEIELLQ